jgi:ribonuclease P/MRP protein subunit POP5
VTTIALAAASLFSGEPSSILSILAVVVAIMSILLAGLSYKEARMMRILFHSLATAGRFREIAKIRRELSRRPRRRYIVFKILSEKDVNERMIYQNLTVAARRLLGSSFLADSGFQLVYYNPLTKKGVIRVRDPYKYLAIGVLGLIRELGGGSALVIPILTTGTIKRAKSLADTL